MPKPADLVLWVPGAEPAKMTPPSGAKRTEGWVAGEKPAFQTMNYLQNNWGQWLAYLEDFTDELSFLIGQNAFDIQTNTTSIGINGNAIDAINADVNSYSFIQADIVSTSGTFTLSSGKISWHISGKKIWVYWTLNGELTGSTSIAISVDVSTNTSLPTSPWPSLIEAVADSLFSKMYHIVGITVGFTIRPNDGTPIQLGNYSWGGSFFHQLP